MKAGIKASHGKLAKTAASPFGTIALSVVALVAVYVLVTHGYFLKMKHNETTVEFAPAPTVSAAPAVLVGNK